MGSKKKKKKKKSTKSKQSKEGVAEEDERFSANRPQFHHPAKGAQSSKVVLDERFASVLTDPRFQLQERDKYGRRKSNNKSQQQAEELGAFYTVETKEDEKTENDAPLDASDSEDEPVKDSSSDEESSSSSSSSDEKDPASRIKYLTALSRGEISVSSSSDEDDDDNQKSDEDSDNDSSDEDAVIYGTAGILDPSSKEDVLMTQTPSPYLAVMNMDWTHVRAVDLFAILASFVPPGGIQRVRVFPSNYGMERMAKEAQYGPSDLWKKTNDNGEGSRSEDEQVESDIEEEDDDSVDDAHERYLKQIRIENEQAESDFDTEKLRAYEASKLKYYFAVVEFDSHQHADKAYEQVDGLELEHSSAAMDLRSIPPEQVEGVIQDRKLRDEAAGIPSNYEPPDFVVSALQQGSVKCTWEDGDLERQRKLTSYTGGNGGAWGALAVAEEDDLRAYLASDASSDDEEEDGSDEENGKAGKLRKMLGLDGSDDDESEDNDKKNESSSSDEEENDFSKQAVFVPGQAKLEDKIRSKLESKNEKELTPWQKYQEKRKEKRREQRQARRKLRKDIGESNVKGKADGMYESDPEFGRAEFDSEEDNQVEDDDFFVSKKSTATRPKNKPESRYDEERTTPSTKEELELLLAVDNDEEDTKDYDMRGIRRIQQNKNKKLRGSRKRKEADLAATVSGQEFQIDTTDKRFAAVLEGTDDRFGIDRTDPNYKDTEAMKELLAEQSRRRRAKKKKVTKQTIVPNVTAADGVESSGVESSGGAAALSSLVMSLKSKVAKKA